MAAGGNVYVGSRGKEFCVFAAEKEKRLLTSVRLDAPMTTTPMPANGVLYITTMEQLHALAISGKDAPAHGSTTVSSPK